MASKPRTSRRESSSETEALAPTGRGVAQHGRLGSAGGGPVGILKWVSIAVVTALVGTVALAALAVAQIYSSLTFVSGDNVLAGPEDSQVALTSLDGGFNFLLVGTDTRAGQVGNYTAEDKTSSLADVIIMLHVSADHKTATAVSFPRDLMVAIPSCPKNDGSGASYPAMSRQQINSSIDYGGVYCTVKTVESLTGLSIGYYSLIDFNGVIEMSNAVGGVTVCSTGAVNDPESGLTLVAGDNTLSGAQALAFLRTRHGFGDGSDLARISGQQVYLSAMMRKLTSAGTLTNPVTVYALASAAAENLKLSQSLANPSTMVSMAFTLGNVNLKNIVFVQAPTRADPSDPNRVILSAEAPKLWALLQSDTPITLADDSTGRGAVLNSASAAASDAASPSAAASSGSAASGSASAPDSSAATASALPSGVTGQTASTQTCAKASR